MAEILFVNSNLHGHINPTLPLTVQLIKRGHRIKYFCSDDFNEKVSATGAEPIHFTKNLRIFLAQYKPSDNHPFYTLIEYMLKYTEVLLPDLLAHINENHYDIILCDSIFGAECFFKANNQYPHRLFPFFLCGEQPACTGANTGSRFSSSTG